jgi:hypothetical protein
MRRNVLKELICTKPCKDIKENIFLDEKENKVFLWLVFKKCCLKKKLRAKCCFEKTSMYQTMQG